MTVTTEKLKYRGTGGELLGLMLVNTLLTIVTLGVYSFWGRTRVRDYLYAQTELAGDRFGYHGTGGELLRGWLKGIGILTVLFLMIGVLFAVLVPTPAEGAQVENSVALFVVQFIYLAIIGVLAAIAINGARRYRLSRSSWRGIRFSYTGRWQDFLALSIKGAILSAITFTLYLPYFRNQSRAFLVNHARFGTVEFAYDADGNELFFSYLKSLLLAIPTLGLSLVWFHAFQHRYFWSHTTFGAVRLRSTVTGGALLGLLLTNALLVLLTLGIGTPWAITRTTRFACDNLVLQGDIDWRTVEQQAQLASATGEGLAQGLDVDADLGLGM